jgi:cytochrome d ubiquinol oxidase subunit I
VATTPFLTSHQVATTLVIFGLVYALIFIFGAVYIYRLWRRGPVVRPEYMIGATNPKRPLSLPGSSPGVSSPSQTPVAEVVR